MKRFQRLSIRTKLTVTILAITILCLGIGFTALGLQRVHAFKEDMRETATLIASVVGDYSVADLAFGDREESEKTLERLRLYPDIEYAALYDREGSLFSTYRKKGTSPGRPAPQRIEIPSEVRTQFRDGYLEASVPITYEGTLYGVIHLRSSTASVGARIRGYLVAISGLLVVLLLLSLLVAGAVQRVISRPILDLTRAAEKIAGGAAPSFRVTQERYDEIGSLARSFNTMVENLEHRQLELRESSETLRALIQACPLAIIASDRRLCVTLWNSEAERIFGVGEADAIGKPLHELLRAPELEPAWALCRDGQVLTGVELSWNRGDDPPTELVLMAVPLLAGEEHQGSMLLVEDVTERKQTQAALRERDSQLQRMQKMEAVGRLAGGVCHDFNNLLTVIVVSATMLGRKIGDDSKLRGEVDTILATAERGTALTRRLLAFSVHRKANPQIVDLNLLIAELEQMLRRVIGEDISLESKLTGSRCHILADSGQLEQVLLNLVINARDAMPRGGRIELRTRTADPGQQERGLPSPGPEGWVRLMVVDTGCGMEPDVASHVFEPFFTTKSHGTGLGLATVHSIVAQCGGRITVQTEVGGGTTFELWFPRALPVEVGSKTESPVRTVESHQATILLVEDEPRLRKVARQILEEEGYTVVEASDGVDAIARCQRLGPLDMLLTDVVMPEMSGPRLAQELLRRYPGLPVLYMSGYVGAALVSHGLEDSSFPILSKPFTPDDLTRMVGEILDQNRTSLAARSARASGASDARSPQAPVKEPS